MLMKITPQLAALVMRKDGQFVRIGLQRGFLPFGAAKRMPTSKKKYSYYISPKKFMEFTGTTASEIRKVAKEAGIKV